MQPTSPFATPRVRLERVRDGWQSWGWLPYYGGESARLRLGEPQDVAIGERFTVQVQGSARVTSFMAEVVEQQAGEVTLRVLGEIRCHSPTLPPRTHVGGLTGRLRTDTVIADAVIVDASDRGAGLMLSVSVPAGERVVIEVENENGPVEVAGEVRYCRALDAPAGQFRIGVQLESLSPWVASQWKRLIERDLGGGRRAA